MQFRSARRLAVLTLAVVALTPATVPAAARKREAVPATGLRAIRFLKPPPDFTYDLGHGPARLSNLTGRVVVLNFWASWCEPCRDELGVFTQLLGAYGDAVPLLTVSSEAPGVARRFLAERHSGVPVVEDPDGKVFDAYSVGPIPVTIVVGRDGTVRHVSVGQLDWSELRDAVEAAGADPPVPGSPAAAAPPELPATSPPARPSAPEASSTPASFAT